MKTTTLKVPCVLEVECQHEKTRIETLVTKADDNVVIPIPKHTYPFVGIWARIEKRFSFQVVPCSIEPGTKTNNLIFNNAAELEGVLIIQF